MLDPADIMSSDEVMATFRLGKSKLERLRSEKRIPYYREGRSIWYRRSELEEWFNAKRVGPHDARGS